MLTHEGTPICAFQHRRLREVPLTGGVSSLRRSDALDPQLYAYALDLLKALKWTGLAMVEFEQNKHGEARLMEINGRIWGSLSVAIAAGVNFPVRLCEMTLNGPPVGPLPSSEDFQVGVHVQDFRKELSWIIRVLGGKQTHPLLRIPKRHEAIGAMIDLFRPSYAFDILSFDDPMPGVRVISEICRVTWQSLVARVPPRTRLTPTDYPSDSQAHESVAIKQSRASRTD